MRSLPHQRHHWQRYSMIWSIQQWTVFVLDFVLSNVMVVVAAVVWPVAIPCYALDSVIPFLDVLWLASTRSNPTVRPDDCVFHLNCYRRCSSMYWLSLLLPDWPPLPLTIGWLVTMPFVAATCIAGRSERLTATNDSVVMHSDSRMVIAVDDAGDCLTSNGFWSVVLLDLLKSVEFQPLLQREPAKCTKSFSWIAWYGLSRWFFFCLPNWPMPGCCSCRAEILWKEMKCPEILWTSNCLDSASAKQKQM